MDKKKCSICGEEKPLTYFHKEKRGILGVRADCKSCRSSKTKKCRNKGKNINVIFN